MRLLLIALALAFAIVCPPLGAQESAAQAEQPAAASSAPANGGGSPDAQIGRFFDRYLWFVPRAPGHRASMGIGVFVALTLLIMLSARMANLDGVTFGRGAAVAAIVLVTVLLQFAFIPELIPVLIAVGLFDAAAWFLLVRGVLGGDAFNAGVMLICCVLAFLVSLLGLEVAGTLLQRSELLA